MQERERRRASSPQNRIIPFFLTDSDTQIMSFMNQWIKLLLSNKVDLDARDPQGRTCLHVLFSSSVLDKVPEIAQYVVLFPRDVFRPN